MSTVVANADAVGAIDGANAAVWIDDADDDAEWTTVQSRNVWQSYS